MTRMTLLLAGGALSALIVGTAVAVSMSDTGDQFAQCRASQVAGGAGAIGGPFELIDETGAAVTDADIITEPSILYFGYTFCPDVCPLDTMRNAQAVYELEDRGISATPIFISVDPERDTPEVVGVFAENFHEKMIGLTGTDEQVAAASRAYKTYYRRHEDDGSGFYLIDHSTFSYLVLPEHGFVEFFRRDDGPEAVADRVQCFVEAA